MKRQPKNIIRRTAGTLTLVAATFALSATLASTIRADMYIPEAAPGGIQVSPVITSFETNGSSATIGFDGLQAPYMIQVSTNSGPWESVGITTVKHPNFSGTAVVTNVQGDTVMYRLMMLGSEKWAGQYNPGALAISNVFAGVQYCGGCHPDQVGDWVGTKHATAIYALMDANGNFTGHANESCVVCHSVGKGQPGGFVDLATTPHLANVQCENCHGSANAHINISGSKYHPVATIAAEDCGGCHNGDHHPTFDEWNEGAHRHQDAHVADYFLSSSSEARQMSCGRCHSAATRMAMLWNYEDMQKGITNFIALPSPTDATNATATCVVCHDPHATNNYTAQLRYPVSSTDFYTLSTSSQSTNILEMGPYGFPVTNTYYFGSSFADEYNPNIQVCGQCHNTRGATWNDSGSRPPHHSPQYNMLIGTIQEGYLTNNLTSRHGRLTEACVTCHVVNYAPGFTNGTIEVVEGGVTNVVPNVTTNFNTGHTFELNYNGCAIAGCHTSQGAEGIKEEVEHEQAIRIAAVSNVVEKLNYWALNVAPSITNAFTTYGQYAWEYNNEGALSNPGGDPTISGPPTSLQTRIPDGIKQARFNLYIFEHDGSYGIHNRQLTPLLISDAEAKVDAETYKLANFSGTPTSGFAPLTVNFQNLGTGSSYDWTFGDGGSTTGADPSHIYNTPGSYTVACTADATETQTRPDYITVVELPVVSFTADPTTVPVGGTINFTNTSTALSGVYEWRWQFDSSDRNTRVNVPDTAPQSWTYNTAGSYNVILRAYTDAGSVYATNSVTVTP